MNKREQMSILAQEIKLIFRWECPCCGGEIIGDDDQTKNEFTNQMYFEGVRFKKMKYMEGVFCKECYLDKDTQNSSL